MHPLAVRGDSDGDAVAVGTDRLPHEGPVGERRGVEDELAGRGPQRGVEGGGVTDAPGEGDVDPAVAGAQHGGDLRGVAARSRCGVEVAHMEPARALGDPPFRRGDGVPPRVPLVNLAAGKRRPPGRG